MMYFQVIQYKSDLASDLKKMEKFSGNLMRAMTMKQSLSMITQNIRVLYTLYKILCYQYSTFISHISYSSILFNGKRGRLTLRAGSRPSCKLIYEHRLKIFLFSDKAAAKSHFVGCRVAFSNGIFLTLILGFLMLSCY